jgi:hypothetical protein
VNDEAATLAIVMLGLIGLAAVVARSLPDIIELIAAWRGTPDQVAARAARSFESQANSTGTGVQVSMAGPPSLAEQLRREEAREREHFAAHEGYWRGVTG